MLVRFLVNQLASVPFAELYAAIATLPTVFGGATIPTVQNITACSSARYWPISSKSESTP